MVDVSVMLGAGEQAVEAQMKSVLDFEMKLAQVNWGQNSFESLGNIVTNTWCFNGACALVCVDPDPLWEPHQWEHVQQVQSV